MGIFSCFDSNPNNCILCLSNLPVELLYFKTIVLSNYIELQWQTASEVNNDYFTVERSTNGINWTIIASIDGAGNSSNLLNYSTTDENPLYGLLYYRLRQTDFNGKFEYSEVKIVNNISPNYQQIFTNTNNNTITITGKESELSEVIIHNALGHDVTHLTQRITANQKQLVIDLSKLNSGIYWIKTKNTTYKLYKQ